MNYEDCVTDIINSSVSNALEKMKTLGPEDRYHLLVEWGEHLFCPIADDEVLMVPNFQTEN
tara:strand:- start:1546 stop:1728 length:183 start_codon:yes stop_codon:yes gene_type:complete